jgi:hypothetical protein
MPAHLSVGDGTSRSCAIDSIAQVYENGDDVVVLVRLNEGLLELRVPRRAMPPGEEPRHVKGVNADATPC